VRTSRATSWCRRLIAVSTACSSCSSRDIMSAEP
jgi:hypothetical protein